MFEIWMSVESPKEMKIECGGKSSPDGMEDRVLEQRDSEEVMLLHRTGVSATPLSAKRMKILLGKRGVTIHYICNNRFPLGTVNILEKYSRSTSTTWLVSVAIRKQSFI